ncbi:Flagellar hook-associated protein 2 [Vibrio chagasii]|uniref:flagellar filament capping protein FliD n=1 Tax=Vibrio chagasii TaxID=170679 RepID=UPI00338CFBC9|nr:Flagellar hook-associated protein 2 [Vibrio chagasii]CAH7026641.1 Flagellar hook-associated protein 2 [Vibrio chagasii]CAH7073740.1 Flagellar hook-associated protein 2 [Vibrio chagasii]
MNVDAVQLASNFASLDVQPFEFRYNQKLSMIASKTSAIGKVKTALQSLENKIYEFTKPSSSLTQTSTSTSSDDYFSLSVDSGVNDINLDVFVQQMASNHQVAFDANSVDSNDVMASGGVFSVTQDGVTTDINIMDADTDVSGDVTYSEFVSYFNDQFDGSIQATLVKSQGAMKVLFGSENEGADAAFTLSADAASGWDTVVATASAAPMQTAQDAVIALGGEFGTQLTNSSNTFESLIDGVDLTLTKANNTGDSATKIEIGDDLSDTVASLQEFVDAYNSAVTKITNLTASGNEDEARGVLASDSAVRSIENQLASVIRDDYNGTRLFELGLEIDRDGKLSLDSSKFESAAATVDFETLFTGSGGVFEAFESKLETYIDFSNGSLNRRIDTLDNEKSRINDALAALDTRYETYYNRYLSQFTQLNSLSSQLDSVSGLFTI